MNPTRAEIDLKKLEHNYNAIKDLLHKENPRKKIKICGVVKANAYGHGIQEISQKLISLGADFLGVANYDEAIKLRSVIPNASILVFGTLIHCNCTCDRIKFFINIYFSDIGKNSPVAVSISNRD